MARVFNVSADFLLSLTNIPELKNYDVGELGLLAQAVRNLYTQKINTDILNRLLKHQRFPILIAMITQYLDDTFAAGVAVQNQIFASMSELLLGARQREAAHAVNLSKVLPHQVELAKIHSTFMAMLREMKRETGSNLEPANALAKEVVERMMVKLSKNQKAHLVSISPEQITNAILHTVNDRADLKKLADFWHRLVSLFENLPRENDTNAQ